MVNKNYDFNQKPDKISPMEIETTVLEFVREIKQIIHKIEKNAFVPVLVRRNLWSPSDEISMSELWDDITFNQIFLLN